LTRAGFENITTEEAPSPDVLAGFVIETNPRAGQVIPRDATITVVVSSGPEPVDVPDLEGLSVSQAESRLNALGLLIVVSGQTVEVPFDSGLIGNVAEQAPSAGSQAEVGTEVTVRLGIARQVSVPNLIGQSTQNAENAAAAVGLNVDITSTTVTNDQTKDGTVATQDPSAGTVVDEGGFIEVTVYEYEPLVPDFVQAQLTLAQAQAQATNIGLGAVSQVGTVATTNASLVGKIASQDPAPGTSVAQGTDIDVTVYILQSP